MRLQFLIVLIVSLLLFSCNVPKDTSSKDTTNLSNSPIDLSIYTGHYFTENEAVEFIFTEENDVLVGRVKNDAQIVRLENTGKHIFRNEEVSATVTFKVGEKHQITGVKVEMKDGRIIIATRKIVNN